MFYEPRKETFLCCCRAERLPLRYAADKNEEDDTHYFFLFFLNALLLALLKRKMIQAPHYHGGESSQVFVYQVEFNAIATGKIIAMSKRRIRW